MKRVIVSIERLF